MSLGIGGESCSFHCLLECKVLKYNGMAVGSGVVVSSVISSVNIASFIAAVLRTRTSAANRSIGSTTDCTITEKAPTRAFSWLKVPTSAFTFKTLLRHHAKWALTPR